MFIIYLSIIELTDNFHKKSDTQKENDSDIPFKRSKDICEATINESLFSYYQKFYSQQFNHTDILRSNFYNFLGYPTYSSCNSYSCNRCGNFIRANTSYCLVDEQIHPLDLSVKSAHSSSDQSSSKLTYNNHNTLEKQGKGMNQFKTSIALKNDDKLNEYFTKRDIDYTCRLSENNHITELLNKNNDSIEKEDIIKRIDDSPIFKINKLQDFKGLVLTKNDLKLLSIADQFITKFGDKNLNTKNLILKIKDEIFWSNLEEFNISVLHTKNHLLPFRFQNMYPFYQHNIINLLSSKSEIKIKDVSEEFPNIQREIYRIHIYMNRIDFSFKITQINSIDLFDNDYIPIFGIDEYKSLSFKLKRDWAKYIPYNERYDKLRITILYVQLQLEEFYKKYKNASIMNIFGWWVIMGGANKNIKIT